MTFRYLALGLCALSVLSACEAFNPPHRQQAPEVVDLPQRPTQSRYELPPGMITPNMDTASLMTKPSVIVFPVDGPIDPDRRSFPEYRGVVENTTAGGYTVFDPSVTVFAVEGPGQRPDYLPEYAVPRYAEQFYPVVAYPETANNPLMPMDSAGPVPIAPGIKAEPLPKPRLPRMTGTPQTDNRLPQAQQQRRSRPVLTGY